MLILNCLNSSKPTSLLAASGVGYQKGSHNTAHNRLRATELVHYAWNSNRHIYLVQVESAVGNPQRNEDSLSPAIQFSASHQLEGTRKAAPSETDY